MNTLLRLFSFFAVLVGRYARFRFGLGAFFLRYFPNGLTNTATIPFGWKVNHVPGHNRNMINDGQIDSEVTVGNTFVCGQTGVTPNLVGAKKVVIYGKAGAINLRTDSEIHIFGTVEDIKTEGNVYVYDGGNITRSASCRQLTVWQASLDCILDITDLFVIGGEVGGEGVISGTILTINGGQVTGELRWESKESQIAKVLDRTAESQAAGEADGGGKSAEASVSDDFMSMLDDELEGSDNLQGSPESEAGAAPTVLRK